MKNLFRNYFTALLLLSAALLLISCNNPASSGEEEHSDPFGVELTLNNQVIATFENGDVSYIGGDHIELEVGEETDLIRLEWISEDGDRFVPNENEGYSLRWVDVNEDVLEVAQHEEDGAWRFHFVGLSAGESEIKFQLFHNGHSDYTTPEPFVVQVEQAASGMELRDDTGSPLITVDESGSVTGSVDVTTNETNGELTAVFLNKEGSDIDLNDEYELDWHVESGSEFVTITPSANNPFAFTLNGESEGQATMHFELIKEQGDHGDEDGGDENHDGIVAYVSPDITITVN